MLEKRCIIFYFKHFLIMTRSNAGSSISVTNFSCESIYTYFVYQLWCLLPTECSWWWNSVHHTYIVRNAYMYMKNVEFLFFFSNSFQIDKNIGKSYKVLALLKILNPEKFDVVQTKNLPNQNITLKWLFTPYDSKSTKKTVCYQLRLLLSIFNK